MPRQSARQRYEWCRAMESRPPAEALRGASFVLALSEMNFAPYFGRCSNRQGAPPLLPHGKLRSRLAAVGRRWMPCDSS